MATVTLPAGTVPIRSLTTGEILTGNRSTSVRYDLLTETEASKGTLDGVTGGSVELTANATVKGALSVNVVDNGQDVAWLTDRFRPVLLVDGLDEQPLGVYVVSEAPEQWADTGRTWPVKLLDKTTILDQDAVDVTYALDAGSVITDEVETLIASTGETNYVITPSSATLASPLVWDPGTSKLRIINDLLAVANYFSLFADFNGQFRGELYVKPASRPIVWEFLDGEQSIYAPDFVRDVDLFAIPNEFIAVGQGDGTIAALSSSATNTDQTSPYSTVSRGRTITAVEIGVETADQDTLDAYALRRLIELTSPTSSIDVQHAFIPGLTFNQAVRLRRVPAGIDARHVVSKTTVSLDPTALAMSTLTEVVDLS
jgi:hypothetical protein